MKTLTKNRRDHCRTGTQKHTETWSKYVDGHCRLSQSEESECLWTHDKDGIVMFSHRFTLFLLRRTAVSVKIFCLSFGAFLCACPTVISSIFGKSFHFPFPYFVIFVLWYFPFHVVWNGFTFSYTYSKLLVQNCVYFLIILFEVFSQKCP